MPPISNAMRRSKCDRRRLHHFVGSYAAFAKLPAPRPEPIAWAAFVAEIAEAHGGRVHLANRDGGGLCVTLDFPTAPLDG